MHISSTAAQAVRFEQLSKSTLNNQQNTVPKSTEFAVGSATDKKQQAAAVKENQVAHDLAAQTLASKNLAVNEQAIALFEQNKQSQSSKTQFSATGRDKPSVHNETAVASYQTIGNLAQRESVQHLLGVDLFA